MGGDGLGGLAMAILLASIVMVALPAVVLMLVLRRTARGKSEGLRYGLMCGGAVLGLVAGLLWVVATFFETTWSPPPRVNLNLPPAFAHGSVILLEQPGAARQLQWSGYELPFMGKSAVLDVPPSGVVRLQSLAGMVGAPFTVGVTPELAVGATGTGRAAKELDATQYVFIALGKVGAVETAASRVDSGESLIGSDDAFAAYVRARER